MNEFGFNYEKNGKARDLGYFNAHSNRYWDDDEINHCFKCGKELLPGEGYCEDSPDVFCRECYLEKLEPTFTLDNAFRYGEEEKETIEINGCIKFLLSKSIERILEEYIYENCDMRDVKDYACEVGLEEWEGIVT